MKKFLLLINPIVYTVLIGCIAVMLQFNSGASFRYTNPQPTEIGFDLVPIQEEKNIQYYMKSLEMLNSEDIRYLETLLFTLLIISSGLLFLITEVDYWIMFGGWIMAYLLDFFMRKNNWFYSCDYFCNDEKNLSLYSNSIDIFYIFFPILVLVSLILIRFPKKAKAPNKSEQSRTPNGEK